MADACDPFPRTQSISANLSRSNTSWYVSPKFIVFLDVQQLGTGCGMFEPTYNGTEHARVMPPTGANPCRKIPDYRWNGKTCDTLSLATSTV